MKIFRYVVMAAVVLGMSSVAHAFSWNLQDPPDGGFFAVTQTGTPFSFTFEDCSFVIGCTHYKGCPEGQNQTNETLTSFLFTFDSNSALQSSPQGPTPDCISDSFAVVTCSLVGSQYVISYVCDPGTVCGIAPDGVFNIYEDAVAGSMFPEVDAIANPTPEPSSIWLALSGMGSLGYLVRRRRRTSSC